MAAFFIVRQKYAKDGRLGAKNRWS